LKKSEKKFVFVNVTNYVVLVRSTKKPIQVTAHV